MRKAIRTILLSAFAAVTIIGCKKNDDNTTPTKTYGKLTVKVNNTVDGNPISFGVRTYTNQAGNQYSVNLLKYYISNFTLIANDNTEHNFRNYKLVNGEDTSTCSFSFDSITNNTFKAIRFAIGVDSSNNHTGLQEGDLDPINGMIWTWATGYIFFKHEGQFTNTRGTTSPLVFHLGKDEGYSTITLPLSSMQINGNDKTIYLKFDLNQLYKNPNIIDFNQDSVRQSTDFTDDHWIADMKANMINSFSISKVE